MYTLSKAFAIVRRMDETSVRNAVFQSVYNSNRLIKFATDIYNISPLPLKTLMLLLYGAKCFASVKFIGNGDNKFLLMGAYPNDVKALTNLESYLPYNEVSWIKLNIRNSINYASIKKLPVYFASLGRLYRFGRIMATKHSFMPACRIFSTLAYYKIFSLLLKKNKPSVIVIASHYGPESLALAAASHAVGGTVVITNHATTANKGALGMPVYADYLVCSGDAIKDVLQSESRDTIAHCYLPVDIPQRSLKLPEPDAKSVVVGIFLTALTNMDELSSIVSKLVNAEWCSQIRIRQHPAKTVNSDCDSLLAKHPSLLITTHIPLQEDISECDIAICGNSTVVVEILRGGVPVAYTDTLDSLPKDYAKFVSYGLLPEILSRNFGQLLTVMQQHYLADSWIDKMRYFDASYQKDEEKIKENCKFMMSRIGSTAKTPATRKDI